MIKTFLFEISPIQNAILAVLGKNRELRALESKYSVVGEVNPPPLSPFTMALNGVVDAPVNGGILMYRKVFLNGGEGEDVKRLENGVREQEGVIERCLEVHERLVGEVMRPLHDSLVGLFMRNYR